ncbi:MAG: DUF2250 domain-containing protein [candidate division Zixibacteria bacterium]|nr:DUF2250 domain-containing protein [candidate division Zixibacteria bacterium]
MKLKEDYILANCCSPGENDSIVGYYSHNNIIKVHRVDCPNLTKADPERLMTLRWADIVDAEDFAPDDDFHDLDETDFVILAHHETYGVDYSLKVAAVIHLDKQTVFDCHTRLREMGLVKRVKPLIIQYRKNIVKNRWIKHRNHTYYELTEKGKNYLAYYKKP